MPQTAWSGKDERQYEHVKESELDRGRNEDRAEEIAARTVNKQRFSEGRTKSRVSRATGNPSGRLEDLTALALRNRARERKIPGRSSMNKSELITAIRQKR